MGVRIALAFIAFGTLALTTLAVVMLAVVFWRDPAGRTIGRQRVLQVAVLLNVGVALYTFNIAQS